MREFADHNHLLTNDHTWQRFRTVDLVLLVIAISIGSFLAQRFHDTEYAPAASSTVVVTGIVDWSVLLLTHVVFSAILVLISMLSMQFLRGRRSVSLGEILGILPIALWGCVACAPGLSTFYLWVLAVLFGALCAVVHLTLRVFWANQVDAQWTNWFGSGTCLLIASRVWIDLLLRPVVI